MLWTRVGPPSSGFTGSLSKPGMRYNSDFVLVTRGFQTFINNNVLSQTHSLQHKSPIRSSAPSKPCTPGTWTPSPAPACVPPIPLHTVPSTCCRLAVSDMCKRSSFPLHRAARTLAYYLVETNLNVHHVGTCGGPVPSRCTPHPLTPPRTPTVPVALAVLYCGPLKSYRRCSTAPCCPLADLHPHPAFPPCVRLAHTRLVKSSPSHLPPIPESSHGFLALYAHPSQRTCIVSPLAALPSLPSPCAVAPALHQGAPHPARRPLGRRERGHLPAHAHVHAHGRGQVRPGGCWRGGGVQLRVCEAGACFR